MKQLFQNTADVKFQQYNFEGHSIYLVTCEAMNDLQLLNEVVVPRIGFLCNNLTSEALEEKIESQLYVPDLKKIQNEQEAVLLVFSGFVLIYFEEGELLFSSNVAQKPNRMPEETRTEVTIKGPRDDFIEDIAVNIALIRKRLPTNSLSVERFVLGTRSKTKVAILYFDDVVDKNILEEIKQQLKKVETDALFSGDVLMERINKKSLLFPRNDYTGRPDYVVQALVRGRFAIFVDGVAYSIITPVNFFLLLKTSEDNDSMFIYSSMERLLRIGSMIIGAFLPAFWLSLTTFHQDQLPFQLLATVVQANVGLPLPSVLEMLLMLFMFELFREAGLRLPTAISSTVGVVGGLIIGDAAIRAGITSPAMIVIIATSTIASFTLVNQSLVTTISVVRVFYILIASIFGLFGFFMSLFITLVYLANIRIFGVPYLSMGADLNWSTIGKALMRLPATKYDKRPEMLNPQDSTRSTEKNDNKKENQ